MVDFDVIIVGSGPAGVSAAFPLVHAGLRVLMVDGGRQANVRIPQQSFLSARLHDTTQSDWMVGKNFCALSSNKAGSPKLRAPTHEQVFDGFQAANRIVSPHFMAVGSLAVGGLSNAWGCGVARLSASELSSFPFDPSELIQSYEVVAQRIGISGCQKDDLSNYFGLDDWAQPPIPMDSLHHHLYHQYTKNKNRFLALDFRMGRSRVAVLSQNHGGRKACDQSGGCLWGCHRRALYTATDELIALRRYDNFQYEHGFLVEGVNHTQYACLIEGVDQVSQDRRSISAHKVLLAAGTLATTGIILRSMKIVEPLQLFACPTAAFLLWVPRLLGSMTKPTFGLGQLSYTLDILDGIVAFGSTFSTVGVPVTELARHLPFQRRQRIDFLKNILSSCLIGNLFLPGNFSNTTIALKHDNSLVIDGGYHHDVADLMTVAKKKVRRSYARLGALLLPMSFTIGSPGSDIHYAGTLPMRAQPKSNETSALGEIHGLSSVHIIDGACLPMLSEKAHTLTIMANADRIGRLVAQNMINKY